MPSAHEVLPQKWSNVEVLYDDGRYSVIRGVYDGSECLGERWNGTGNGFGFPHQADKPLWHVVPSIFTLPILYKLLDLHLRNPSNEDEVINNILQAIRFFQETM